MHKHRITMFEGRDNNHYCLKVKDPKLKSWTVKGEVFALTPQNKKETLLFTPNLKGTYHLDAQLLTAKQNDLKISLYRNGKLLTRQTLSDKGLNTIRADLKLNKKDTVKVILAGNGVFVFSDIILSKDIPKEDRKYIFLISADTLRADRLSCYGYSGNKTPHIDKFSEDSVLFLNTYTPSPWTLPAHVSLFTSLDEFRHGVNRDHPLKKTTNFLVENLSEKFITHCMNGGGYLSPRFRFYRGFDLYHSDHSDPFTPYASRNLFTRAIRDITDNPLPSSFYFLHTYQTHSPYNPLSENIAKINPNLEFTELKYSPKGMPYEKDFKTRPHEIAKNMSVLYDAEIIALDTWFGKFLDFLKEKNIYRQAMVIFLSDHGEEFYEHDFWTHSTSVYNEVVKIPLIVKFPDNRFKGKKIENLTSLVDVMPTVLNYYRINWQKAPETCDGIDLMELINGKKQRKYCISSITAGYRHIKYAYKVALIKKDQKIIFNIPYKIGKKVPKPTASPRAKFELYKFPEDAGEKNNVFLKHMRLAKKYYPLFNTIIQMALDIEFNSSQKSYKINKELRKRLKSLGYFN